MMLGSISCNMWNLSMLSLFLDADASRHDALVLLNECDLPDETNNNSQVPLYGYLRTCFSYSVHQFSAMWRRLLLTTAATLGAATVLFGGRSYTQYYRLLMNKKMPKFMWSKFASALQNFNILIIENHDYLCRIQGTFLLWLECGQISIFNVEMITVWLSLVITTGGLPVQLLCPLPSPRLQILHARRWTTRLVHDVGPSKEGVEDFEFRVSPLM